MITIGTNPDGTKSICRATPGHRGVYPCTHIDGSHEDVSNEQWRRIQEEQLAERHAHDTIGYREPESSSEIHGMGIGEAIDHYRIFTKTVNGRQLVGTTSIKPTDGDADNVRTWMKNNKAAILKELESRELARRDAANAHAAFIDGILGLKDIRHMMDVRDREYEERNRAFASDGSIVAPDYTYGDRQIRDALSSHPGAALWLDAERLSCSHNYELSAIGDEAKKRYENHESIADIRAYMQTEHEKFIQHHMWD